MLCVQSMFVETIVTVAMLVLNKKYFTNLTQPYLIVTLILRNYLN